MTRPCRSPILLLVLVAAAVVAGAGVAAAAPTVPTPPALPTIQLPPGSKTVHFKVIVEGRLTATKHEDLGTADGITCTVSVHSILNEVTTFQRGKGVVLEFVRIGKGPRAPIIIQRTGRKKDASLILRVTTRRTAEGSAFRADPPGATVSVCQPRTEDLSQGPDCNKAIGDTERASFVMMRASATLGLLRLALNPFGTVSENECPLSEIDPGVDSLLFGWPFPVKATEMRFPLNLGQVFGSRKVIVETFDTGIINAPVESVAIGTLVGKRTNFGSNKVTVRLIRVP